MKTAVIYARYSCDNQTEQSIEGQLRVCQDYAKAHDILILDTYIDRAMTGTNDNRADFQRMIKDSARKEWNYVLVYKLDRFSRDKYATAIHKKTLKDNGVKVLSAMENIPDTPEGIILESLLEGMNQYYFAELSQKVKRGMKETRLKGLYQGGTLPYGYKLDGRKIVIDEKTSEIVKYMFEEYSKGVNVKDIIATLTAKGVHFRGKPFIKNTVYNILRNDKYTGTYKLGDEIVSSLYPRIISDDIFEKVRKRIQANKYGKTSIDVVYLLKNKLKCGYCGESINAENGTAKNGQRRYYYKCNGRKKRKNDCKKAVVRKEVLENFILQALVDILNDPKEIDFIVKGLMKMQEDVIAENTTLRVLEKEQKQTENAIRNIISAIEQGIITSSTNKRLRELEQQQEELERAILVERSRFAIKATEKSIRNFFEKALKAEPMILINYYVKEIILYDDEIKIVYNSPIKIGPDDSQGFSFYNKMSKISMNITNTPFSEMRDIRLVMIIAC